MEAKKLNCLFCYCPLYTYDCKGNYSILENGWKDCSKCLIPHSENGYEYIIKFIKEEMETKNAEHRRNKL